MTGRDRPFRKGDRVRVDPDVASSYFYPVRMHAERLKPARIIAIYGDKALIDFEHIMRPELYRYLIQLNDLEHAERDR